MTIPKEMVLKHINDNFNPGTVTLEYFPLLPGGQIVWDRFEDQLLIYYDITNDCFRSQFPDGSTRREN